MSQTLSFDAEEAASIISNVKATREFLQIPTTVLRSRDYERERRKLTAFELHIATLTEYYKVERIPRGLRSRLRPTLFKEDQDFCLQFENILNKSSFDIILLTIKTLQKKIEESTKKVESIESQLSEQLSTSEWTTLREKTDKAIEEFRSSTESVKRNKFIRDTEDYLYDRVYKWQDQLFYPKDQHSRDPSTSSSEGRPRDRRGRFLGRQPASQPNRPRGRGGARGGAKGPNTERDIPGTQTQVQG
ncbi:uncharacterized protein [Dendropsophus ebraccatus]|uniref:uncharacterized protein n=1 Tax=Dendropsophus ebraccatus TaxID=150705 RepID=UPI00383152E3